MPPNWLEGLATVEFDLETGPQLGAVFPDKCLSSAATRHVVALAFPDSDLRVLGSSFHVFSIPTRVGASSLVGYSLFTQHPDVSIPRGLFLILSSITSFHIFAVGTTCLCLFFRQVFRRVHW